MALTICKIPAGALQLRRPLAAPRRTTPPCSAGRTHVIVSAAKKFSTGKNRKGSVSTTKEQVKEVEEANSGMGSTRPVNLDPEISKASFDDGFVMPKLPGQETDFWEGPQWDALGFFVQYMWAFGILFALIACGIAVVTYNDGATDFKETPAYKESVESQGLLEGPEASNSDVFESNPTEVAPSLE